MSLSATRPALLAIVSAAGLHVGCNSVPRTIGGPLTQTLLGSSKYLCDDSSPASWLPPQANGRPPKGTDPDNVGDAHNRFDRDDHFRFCIDLGLTQQQKVLSGLDFGPARLAVVSMDPSGAIDHFVSDEVVYRPKNPSDLEKFLTRYNGAVLRDGSPVIIPNNPAGATSGPSSGAYLIHIDLSQANLATLAENMRVHGILGQFRFSSLQAAQLLAVVAAESNTSPNYVGSASAGPLIPEHADGNGSYLDAATFRWLDDEAPLQTNVIRAWDYLRFKGFPPKNGQEHPAVIAILDAGFDVDAAGVPQHGNLDYGFTLQADVIDHDSSADAPGCTSEPCASYHGQSVFSIAAAIPGNRYGVAGTAGQYAQPMLIRIDEGTYSWSDAIRLAAVNGADVANLSYNYDDGCTSSLCHEFVDSWYNLQSNITFAASGGTTGITAPVVVSAGNGGREANFPPCSEDNVICVGAVGPGGDNPSAAYAESYSNFGPELTIWAPDLIFADPNPTTINEPLGPQQLVLFDGTSCAAPFVAGVVGLIKQLNHGFTFGTVQESLIIGHNPSPDPKVSQGIVNALKATMFASPDAPPTLSITSPADGATVGVSPDLIASLDDSQPGFNDFFYQFTVNWYSDKDGPLCQGDAQPQIDCQPSKLSFGTHRITAVATDPFGIQSGVAAIILTVQDENPIATITYPSPGAVFYTSQKVELRGYATVSPGTIVASLQWSSSIDGALAPTGGDVFVSLSAGTHVITLTATDSEGLTGQDTVTLVVKNGADVPTVMISIPPAIPLQSYAPGTTETLSGSATDPVDASFPDSAFVWTDDVDGTLVDATTGKTGPTIHVILSGRIGDSAYHTITLKVTNSSGISATSQVTVVVGTIF